MGFLNNKKTRKGGGRGLSLYSTDKARSIQRKSKQRKSRTMPSMRLTRRNTHSRTRGNKNSFLVLIMTLGGVEGNMFNAIEAGKEIRSQQVTNPMQTQILRTQMSSIYPSQSPERFENMFDNMELYVACTGNTCRSTAIKIAGAELGMHINTCGTAARRPGSGPTPALSSALTTPLGREIGSQHGSVQCDPCGDMFNDSHGKIYGVVANKNKLDLLKLAAECKKPIHPLNIFVLGDELEPCKPLKEDPFFVSKDAICPDGDCTEEQLKTERLAYSKLVEDSRNCVTAIQQLARKSTAPTRKLTRITEG